jgi:DNA repair protein SbcD/Mre11
MKVLHTADWHAGRTLHGRDRTPDIRDALYDLVEQALAEEVDAVLIAGDLFDMPTPSAAAERVVYNTLHALALEGIPIALIAGNHDSPDRIEALRPTLSLGGVYAFGVARTAGDGGAATIATRAGDLHIAALPFVSHRRLVRSAHLLDLGEVEQRMVYQDGMRTLIRNLAGALPTGAGPRILLAHGTMDGATLSSEYVFHSHEAYALPASVIPESIDYAALGHIHVPQGIADLPDTRGRYPGSLVQLDFGEDDGVRGPLLVTFNGAGAVERVRTLPIAARRPLLTETVTLDTLDTWASGRESGSAWVRLRIISPEPRPGIKERILRAHPDVIIVDLVLPEHERPEPVRIDLGRMDMERAFFEYHVDQRGREPTPALATAFKRVLDATTPTEAA